MSELSGRTPYTKPWRSFDEQIEILSERGFADAADFRAEIERIGYYRLSGYWYTFREIDPDSRQRQDRFFADASMAHVVALYDFDDRLRKVVWNALTHVELALRVQVGYHLGRIDRFMHLEPAQLDPTHDQAAYAKFASDLQNLKDRSREDFVKHFYDRYDGRLPVWVVTEIMQLGQLVKLFEFAPYSARITIAEELGIRAVEYRSWLKSLNIVRNVVAHHGRLWNRAIVIQPRLPRPRDNALLAHVRRPVSRVYGTLAVLAYLLDRLGCQADIAALREVLVGFPDLPGVSPQAMGLPIGWEREELWV